MITGLHHVTAIAGDPQANFDFYTGVLGLRLVKKTVNFDDPGTYHLYFGNELGTPGTIMTFFLWAGASPGRTGTGQVNVTSFSVPPGSLGFWRERFVKLGVPCDPIVQRFDEEVLLFRDPDNMQLELVAHHLPENREPWTDGPIPGAQAIRGFFGITAAEEGYERTAKMLTGVLGFKLVGDAGNRFRYAAGGGEAGTFLDLLCTPDAHPARSGAGTVHHIAWRVADDAAQEEWRQKLAGLGFNVSPIMDRQYFRSIYFREPGGVLFEIATDPPGFTLDESIAELGTALKVPSWLEGARAQIEKNLPPLHTI